MMTARTILLVSCIIATTTAALTSSPTDLRAEFQARAQEYLKLSINNHFDNGISADFARALLAPTLVNGSGILDSLGNMHRRSDCSDFPVSTFIRMLWQAGNNIDPALREAVQKGLLDWQYWIDEANIAGGYFQGNMMFWTENHQFSFHSSEYMAGALLLNETFIGTNMTGAQHKAKGKEFVRQWLERRFRWGFSEWKSETYLTFDVQNLAHLTAVAPDEDIRIASRSVLDLLLYDLSIHAHKGMIGSSRGRSYGADKFSITTQSVAPALWLLSGKGYRGNGGDGGAIALALTMLDQWNGGYHIPDVVLGIAAVEMEEMENRERISIATYEKEIAEASDLGYTHADDGLVWWGDGAYGNPETAQLAFIMGDTWNLYDSNETTWKYLKYARPLAHTPIIGWITTHLAPITQGATLGPVHSYSYRTPDTMLSCAMDYNKGWIGMQQHSWSATLNGSVLVFTTQPGPNTSNLIGVEDLVDAAIESAGLDAWKALVMKSSLHLKSALLEKDDDVADGVEESFLAETEHAMRSFVRGVVSASTAASQRPPLIGDNHSADYADGQWSGSASLPRVAQYKNVLISLYKPPMTHLLGRVIFPPRTHAFFPRPEMDEVVDHLNTNGWIFGRSGNGFVALYSNSKKLHWQDQFDYNDQFNMTNRELIAEGSTCVWVCVTGRAADAPFSQFISDILAGSVKIDDAKTLKNVQVTLGSGLKLNFGWEANFTVQQPNTSSPVNVPLSGYQRLDSPFAQVAFPAKTVNVTLGDSFLYLDYDQGVRIVSEERKAEQEVVVDEEKASCPQVFSPFTSSLRDVAKAAAQRTLQAMHHSSFLHYAHFAGWGYEGGMIQTGLWELSQSMPEIADMLHKPLSDRLDHFENTNGQLGYKLIHRQHLLVPFGYSVGDHLGLYPLAYATRAQVLGASSPSYKSDLELVNRAVVDYVAKYPHHLEDGTISRPLDWLKEGMISPGFKGVWVDDSFMGTALMGKCALLKLDGCGVDMALWVGKQQLLFRDHMRDDKTGLYHHGYNNATGDKSCCFWGRGNGWALMAKADALLSMQAVGLNATSSPVFAEVLDAFVDHARAMVEFQQSDSGMWLNVLTRPRSTPETSVTAMTAYALVVGMEQGWLAKEDYAEPVKAAAHGLIASVCATNGEVQGIIGETMIHDDADGYDSEGRSYSGAAPGLGGVLRAFAALVRVSEN